MARKKTLGCPANVLVDDGRGPGGVDQDRVRDDIARAIAGEATNRYALGHRHAPGAGQCHGARRWHRRACGVATVRREGWGGVGDSWAARSPRDRVATTNVHRCHRRVWRRGRDAWRRGARPRRARRLATRREPRARRKALEPPRGHEGAARDVPDVDLAAEPPRRRAGRGRALGAATVEALRCGDGTPSRRLVHRCSRRRAGGPSRAGRADRLAGDWERGGRGRRLHSSVGGRASFHRSGVSGLRPQGSLALHRCSALHQRAAGAGQVRCVAGREGWVAGRGDRAGVAAEGDQPHPVHAARRQRSGKLPHQRPAPRLHAPRGNARHRGDRPGVGRPARRTRRHGLAGIRRQAGREARVALRHRDAAVGAGRAPAEQGCRNADDRGGRRRRERDCQRQPRAAVGWVAPRASQGPAGHRKADVHARRGKGAGGVDLGVAGCRKCPSGRPGATHRRQLPAIG